MLNRVLLALAAGVGLLPAQPVITTLAGGGPMGGPALSTGIGEVTGLASDKSGNVYISSAGLAVVFKLDTSGNLSVFAGNGQAGFSGDGGPAVDAQLNNPQRLAIDGSGAVYIADYDNHRIRKVSGGIITTVAGNGQATQWPPTEGPALSVGLTYARSIAVSEDGTDLYIGYEEYILRVRFGLLTRFAGTGEFGDAGDGGIATLATLDAVDIAMAPAGDLLLADAAHHRVRRVSSGKIYAFAGTGAPGGTGDGGLAVSAQLSTPVSIAVSPSGDVFIGDGSEASVRRVSGGIITTVAGNHTSDPRYPGEDGPALSSAVWPTVLAVEPSGAVLIGDGALAHNVRRLTGSYISGIAGNGIYSYSDGGGSSRAALLGQPSGVLVDPGGVVYFCDTMNHRVRKITPSGRISTVAGNGSQGFSGDGGPATAAQLWEPVALARSGAGDLYIADSRNLRVRKVSGGIITTFAGGGLTRVWNTPVAAADSEIQPVGLAFDDDTGTLYVSDDATNGVKTVRGGMIRHVAGNGNPIYAAADENGPATSAAIAPQGLAYDRSTQTLYVAEVFNSRVRAITAGIIRTVAGADGGQSGDNVPATSASLHFPFAVSLDTSGNNLFIADSYSNRIRKVTGGMITTVAGNGRGEFSGDNGLAALASLNQPRSLAVDAGGNIYIADTANNRIRVVSQSAPVAVIIHSSPTSETVIADGDPVTGTGSLTWLPGTTHTLFAGSRTTADTIITFNSWSNGGPSTQTFPAPSSSTTYTAYFNASYRVTSAVSIAGGATVSMTPPPSSGFYPAGAQVQLTAQVAPGFAFLNWTGLPGSPHAPAASVTVNGPMALTANVRPNAEITSPTPGELLPPNEAFFWLSSTLAEQIRLDFGSAPGLTDIASLTTVNPASSASVFIPCNGRTVYVSAYTKWQGTWYPPMQYVFPRVCDMVAFDASMAANTFQFQFQSNSQALTEVRALINADQNESHACELFYSPATNGLRLMNDAGAAKLGPVTPGGAGSLANSQCSIPAAGVSVATVAGKLTLTVPIVFTGAFHGDKTVWESATNSTDVQYGPEPVMHWTVGCDYAVSAPSALSIPSQGGLFTAQVTTGPGCWWKASHTAELWLGGDGSGTGSGSFSYSVAENPGDARRATFRVGGRSFVVQQRAKVTNPTGWIHQLYLDLLGRDPDSAGLVYWNNILVSGASAREALAASFFQSPEFSQRGLFVIKLYESVLGRFPDYAGFRYWLATMNAGETEMNMVNSFIASTEYMQRFGNPDNRNFVIVMYRNVLLRDPDAAGLAYWTGMLDSNSMTRAGLMQAFVVSPELDNRIRNQAYAFLLYAGFLARDPDTSGFAYWTGVLNQGSPLAAVISMFINSPEYQARF